MELFANTFTKLRTLPPSALVIRAARKLLRGAGDVGAMHIFTWETGGDPGRVKSSPFRGAEVLEPGIARVACALAKDEKAFTSRLRAGDRCFCAFLDDLPVHARWVAMRPVRIPELDRWFVPGKQEAYVYDSFTAPDFRGRRAIDVARRVMNATLHAEGIGRAWNYILSDNVSSLRGLSSVQRKVFTIPFVRIGRTFLVFMGSRPVPLAASVAGFAAAHAA